MNVNFEHYKIFYYVAKYGNITRAADALMSNQPNVTRTIKNLESALTCKLFYRSNKGVELTEEGEILYKHIAICMKQILRAEERIAARQSFHEGIVNIGTSEIALRTVMLPALEQYKKAYPNIKIKVTNKSTPNVIKELKQGFVDFALVSGPIEDEENLFVREVSNFREDVICGRELYESLIKDRTLTFEELFEIPLIAMDKGTASYEFYNSFLLEKGIEYTVDTYVATVDQILPMVIYNMGIGFLSDKFIPESFYGKEVFKVKTKEPLPLRSIFFVKRKSEPLTIAAKELKRMIFEK